MTGVILTFASEIKVFKVLSLEARDFRVEGANLSRRNLSVPSFLPAFDFNILRALASKPFPYFFLGGASGRLTLSVSTPTSEMVRFASGAAVTGFLLEEVARPVEPNMAGTGHLWIGTDPLPRHPGRPLAGTELVQVPPPTLDSPEVAPLLPHALATATAPPTTAPARIARSMAAVTAGDLDPDVLAVAAGISAPLTGLTPKLVPHKAAQMKMTSQQVQARGARQHALKVVLCVRRRSR